MNVLTAILRAYLAETTMDHLAGALKKGGIKDLLSFFPPNRRTDSVLDAHFRGAGLSQIADWWTRKQNAVIKEDIAKAIKESLEHKDQPLDVRLIIIIIVFFFFAEGEGLDCGGSASCCRGEASPGIRYRSKPLSRTHGTGRLERGSPGPNRGPCSPRSLGACANLSYFLTPRANRDQRFTPIIEPFCTGPKTEVALINTVQSHCYEDTRIRKAFPQILKVRLS